MRIGIRNRTLMACAIGLVLASAVAAQQAGTAHKSDFVAHAGQRYDLSQRAGVQAIIKVLDAEIAAKEQAKDDANGDEAVAKKPRSAAKGAGSRKPKYAGKVLKEMRRTAGGMLDSTEPIASDVQKMRDMEWAEVHKSVTPPIGIGDVDVILRLFSVRNLTLNASGRGNRHAPASNLTTYASPDLSTVDPKLSTFWSRPSAIADKDLLHGFDRTEIDDIGKEVVEYDRPHTGYGAHPSIYVKWRGESWKCKFGEEHSEPFGCRVFWALGFNAYPTDYAPELKVRYVRDILTQFNSRKTTSVHVRALGIPIVAMSDKTYLNPFDCIRYAVLKDGSKVSAVDLRTRLFAGAGLQRPDQAAQAEGRIASRDGPASAKAARLPSHPELRPDLYDPAFEGQIDYLVMKGVNLRVRDKGDEIGAWDFNEGDTHTYRETRGLGLLNAWLDNWDVRWGNNHLELVKDDDGDGRHLVHIMSDLGAEFGNSTGYIRPIEGKMRFGLVQNIPNGYGWSFTSPVGLHQESVPIKYYMPIEKNRAFNDMNIDDARWMARLIGQLSEDQLKQGLIGSGFDAATGRFLLEKLVGRRDKMISDLGLAGEIRPIRPSGPDKRISYDPRTDGPFSVNLADGSTIAAPDTGDLVVLNGRLEKRPMASSARPKLTRAAGQPGHAAE